MTLRTCTCLLTFLLGMVAHASHIIGGELYYDHNGGQQYTVTLKLYRDCGPGAAAYDPMLRIGVFSGAGVWVQHIEIPYTTAVPVPLVNGNPCLGLPGNTCVEVATFSRTVVLAPSLDGYVLAYHRCCRPADIVNLADPASVGITCSVVIPPVPWMANSSPRFTGMPPIALCLNEPVSFDHAAFDPDGDSLVYSMTTPYNGGTAFNPTPEPYAPPYAPVTWLPPFFSEADQMNTSPPVAIDQAGLLTVTPAALGKYTVAVAVKEYRNGVLLSEVRRDLCFVVVPCAPITAVVRPQAQAEICTGLAAQFHQEGLPTEHVHWDFGVPGITSDTSDQNAPSYVYPVPGIYTVTLITNPGLWCADTAMADFAMYVRPEPLLAGWGDRCVPWDTVLTLGGSYYPDASIHWDLGSADPPTAQGSTVHATWAQPGTQAVTATVVQHGCTGMATTTFQARPAAQAYFTLDPPGMQLFGAPITVQRSADPGSAPAVSISWTVNGTEMPWDPWTEVWTPSEPGLHVISLTVVSASGCTDVRTIEYLVRPVDWLVPNVFTPNGDGRNDYFVVPYLDLVPNRLLVFDRWGTEVLAQHNYRNTWNGRDRSDGVYYYLITLDDGTVLKGHVAILR